MMKTEQSIYAKLLSNQALVRALDRRVTNSSDTFDGKRFLDRFAVAVKKRTEWATAQQAKN
jgi:hypothetical protein